MANTRNFKAEKALAENINHICPRLWIPIVAYLLLFIIMIICECCLSGVDIGKWGLKVVSNLKPPECELMMSL